MAGSQHVPSALRRLRAVTGQILPEATAARMAEGRVIEMRVYYSPSKDKLERLHDRIRHHGARLVERHGIQNLGHFVPVGENPENKLVFFLGFANQTEKKTAWAEFVADEEWKRIKAESEKDGGLVCKVESTLMAVSDFSPIVTAASDFGGVFELRDYLCEAERLLALHARFRNHTVGLFEKHGMRNVAYFAPFTPTTRQEAPTFVPSVAEDDETRRGRLVYLLNHNSVDAAAGNFKKFLEDFLPIVKASEEAAGGPLTLRPMALGVRSEFLRATDYSAVR